MEARVLKIGQVLGSLIQFKDLLKAMDIHLDQDRDRNWALVEKKMFQDQVIITLNLQ